jgi:hypothetical protein
MCPPNRAYNCFWGVTSYLGEIHAISILLEADFRGWVLLIEVLGSKHNPGIV